MDLNEMFRKYNELTEQHVKCQDLITKNQIRQMICILWEQIHKLNDSLVCKEDLSIYSKEDLEVVKSDATEYEIDADEDVEPSTGSDTTYTKHSIGCLVDALYD